MNKTNLKQCPRTDWEGVRNRKDEDIDFSDSPELDEEFFANAILREPTSGPHSIHVFRVDPESGEEITVSVTEVAAPAPTEAP